jgi:hypothetical protein
MISICYLQTFHKNVVPSNGIATGWEKVLVIRDEYYREIAEKQQHIGEQQASTLSEFQIALSFFFSLLSKAVIAL